MSNLLKGLVAATAALLPLAAVGCGPSYSNAFSHHFLDNQEADLGAVLSRLPEASQDDSPENALDAPLVAVATHTESGEGRQLAVYRVDSGEQLWATNVDAATQPEILGDVVVVSTRERLVAYDLSGGRELWHYDLPDLAYVGATRDGDTIYWSATVGALGGARRVGHVVAMDARSGAERWRHEVQGVFGQPAASGGLVFVPWERQNIAVLDEATGDELARLRSTDDVIAWAFDHPTGVYYGGRGMYRLTHRNVSGTRADSTHLRPPLGELPRQPDSIWPDGFVPRPGGRSARGRIRVYFNPAPAADDASIQLEGDTYYFVYYRYVFAYDLEGTLRWTRHLEQDVANAEAMPHGLLTVGEQGQLTLLDRDTGNTRWERGLDVQIASVGVDAAGFQPGGEAGDARGLRESLNELVLDPDNRLVAARAYAVQLLSAIDNEEITRDLLDLYQQRSMPGALKEEIREALRTRRSGAQYLMAALDRRYDYLEETQAPPLEAIVPALLEMEHAEAVPLLINHMMDHETPAEVLPLVVNAVVTLGQGEVLDALRRFLVLYRADSLFAGPVADQAPAEEGGEPVRANPEARALAMAARGLFEHGGEDGRAQISALAADTGRTHAPVSEYITGLYTAEQEAAEQEAARQERERLAALEELRRQEEAALPTMLSQETINNTFAENADAIRECVANEMARLEEENSDEQLTQVRVLFILSSDGRASQIAVSPDREPFSHCMEQRVTDVQFPRFRSRRQRARWSVSISGAGSAQNGGGAATASALPADAPWWMLSQYVHELQAQPDLTASETIAWWEERDPPADVREVETQQPEFECPPGMSAAACEARREALRRAQEEGSGETAATSGGTTGGTTGGGTTGGGTTGGGTTGGGTTGGGTTGGGTTGGGSTGSTGSTGGTTASTGGGSGSTGSTGSTGGTTGGTTGGGTPWWAATGGDDNEEEEEEEEE